MARKFTQLDFQKYVFFQKQNNFDIFMCIEAETKMSVNLKTIVYYTKRCQWEETYPIFWVTMLRVHLHSQMKTIFKCV